VQRGNILQDEKRYAEAVSAYQTTLELRPDYTRALRLQGEALFRLAETDADPDSRRRHYEEASRRFDQYVTREKAEAGVYQTRGLVRAKLGNHLGAVDDYTRALEMAPDAATHAQRGWELLLALDAPTLALRDFEAVIKSNPKNGEAYNGRGLCRVRLGPYREAVADAEEALRRGPPTPFLLYNAARIYSLAAARIELEAGGKPDVQTRERRRQHEERAMTILGQALEALPAPQREKFWHDSVEKDLALGPIRPRDGYKQLAAKYVKSLK
jgi:tetratricopeptide (TPR) repeat protein